MNAVENADPTSAIKASGWKERKLKFVSVVRTSNVDKHIIDGETPVGLCNYTDVYYNEKITSALSFMQGSATEDELDRFRLKEGQVLLTKDSESWEDIAVPAYVAETMPAVLCGYHLAIIEPEENQLDGQFVFWIAQSPVLNDQFKLSAKGVTRFGLSQHALKNASIKVPPLFYQQKTATFLDRKTAEIDTLIDKKRRLLDRLAEKRTALITRAVTKGLDPDVPMKDSGIEWLGEVPEHWEVTSFRWRCSITSGQVDPREPEYADLPLVAPDHIESNTGRLLDVTSAEEQGAISGKYYFPEGTLLYSKIRPNLSKVCIAPYAGLCSADMYPIIPSRHIMAKYLMYQLLADRFRSYAVMQSLRVAMPKLNREALGSAPIIIPSLEEQEAIIDYVDRLWGEIDSVSGKVHKAIFKLEEYRSSLITNAVTGRIKVA
ncbi:restriction endonuclease subunit S [Alcanivorax sp. ZXX171]|nr:restriction endonuclease subunit S [Alcanivorax sp. ZXX171]